jgi:uncharacterized membrane protein
MATTPYGTADAGLTLTVNAAAKKTFDLEAVPDSLTLHQGEERRSRIVVTSLGSFNSEVKLSVSGLPKGVTARFAKDAVTPPANGKAISILHLMASDDANLGTATITVTGSSGSISQSTRIALTVEKKEWRDR